MKKYLKVGAEADITRNETGGLDITIIFPPKTYYSDEGYFKAKYDKLYGALVELREEFPELRGGTQHHIPSPNIAAFHTNRNPYKWNPPTSQDLHVPAPVTTYGVTPMPLRKDGKKEDVKSKEKRNTHKDLNLTEQQVKEIFNYRKEHEVSEFTKSLNKYMEKYGTNNVDALEQFLGQVGGETSGLGRPLIENMDYNEMRLKKTFPSFFAHKYNPKLYVHNAAKLGDLVYEKGGGYKYRGRGVIQLTSKDEYKKFFEYYNKEFNTNLDYTSEKDLDKVGTDMDIAVISGLWYFKNKVLNSGMDINKASVEDVTGKINPHNMGISDRDYYYKRAVNILFPKGK